MSKNVLVTGGFDPIHSGHIAYLKSAKMLGDVLWVGLNSDAWLARKKGQYFLDAHERLEILSNLKVVDHVFLFNDKDNSACDAINYVLEKIPSSNSLIFANGGDRTVGNIPEIDKFESNKCVSFKFGVGGEDKKIHLAGF